MNGNPGTVSSLSEHSPLPPGQAGRTQPTTINSITTGAPKRRRGPRKVQRIILSCIECRRRKLSCDRQQPCQRCVESGTSLLCRYDIRSRPLTGNEAATVASQAEGSGICLTSPVTVPATVTQNAASHTTKSASARESAESRLQALEEQNAKLRQTLLIKEVELSTALRATAVSQEDTPASQQSGGFRKPFRSAIPQGDNLRRFVVSDDRARSVAPHGAQAAFEELLHGSPSVSTSNKDWLSQLGDHLPNADHIQRRRQSEELLSRPALSLEAHLPCKQTTDDLVTWYLDECEPLHRIIHRPSFLEQYASFWDSQVPRQGVFTMVVLAMASIAHCLGRESGHVSPTAADIPCSTRLGWIAASQDWLDQHGDKFYRLAHLQAACLMQLARRVNRFNLADSWLHASKITRGAISVGLHRDLTSQSSSVFQAEMLRRVWGAVAVIDVHACLNQGLPTLLAHLHIDAQKPHNIEDDDLDAHSTPGNLSSLHSEEQYTATSFLIQSLKTLSLRLDLLCHLATTQHGRADHERALRYTDRITETIENLPCWNAPPQRYHGIVARKSKECRLLLELELRQYIMPLHQPFLDSSRDDTRAQFSKFLYYKAIRDLIILQEQVLSLGGLVAGAMHDDALRFGLGLTRVALLDRGQARDSVSCPEEILALMKKCLRFEEIRSLQCGSAEGSHFAVLCAMAAFFEAFFGAKTVAAAKEGYREAFSDFQTRLRGRTAAVDNDENCSTPVTSRRRQTRQGNRRVVLSSADAPTPLSPVNSAPTYICYDGLQPGSIQDSSLGPFSDFSVNWDSGYNNPPGWPNIIPATCSSDDTEAFVDLNSFMLDLGLDFNSV